MANYMMCSALTQVDDEGVESFIHVPLEVSKQFPTPARYIGHQYAVFGVRPSNPDDYTIVDVEAMGLNVAGSEEEGGLTLEEFDNITITLMKGKPGSSLVYFSKEQIQLLYEKYKSIEDDVV